MEEVAPREEGQSVTGDLRSPAELAVWAALQAEYEKVSPLHLRELILAAEAAAA